MQGTQLRYVIKFVADTDRAVKFYRDVMGLQLKFESPGLDASVLESYFANSGYGSLAT